MKKIITVATLLTVLLFTAVPAQAALTEAQIQSILSLLRSFGADNTTIANVEASLRGTTPPPSGGAGACNFTRNLFLGVRGDDVTCLQNYLIGAGYSIPAGATGYYGSQTRSAVSAWQAANGVSPASGYFGPLSRAKYSQLVSGAGTGTGGGAGQGTGQGAEGSFTVVIGSPGNSTVDAGVDIPVYGIKVRAYGSDITINRVDLQFTVKRGTDTYSPSTLITAIKAWDGSTVLKTVSSPVFTQDSNLNWFTQVSGINFVVPKDQEKTLTFSIDTVTALDNNRTVKVQVYGSNGIRGTDGAGISSYQGLAVPRTHTIQVPGQATLTLALAPDNPFSNNWENDVTNGTKNLTLLKFTAKATGGNATLQRLAVNTWNGAASGSASRIIPTVLRLKDGSTVVAEVTPTTSDFPTFENFNLNIPSGTTKTLTIEGDYLPVDSTSNLLPTNNNVAELSIPAISPTGPDYCVFMRSDGSQQKCTVSSQLDSNDQFLFRKGVRIEFLGGTATVTTLQNSAYATGVLKFRVTPFGGTMEKTLYASAGSGTENSITVHALTSTGAIYATGASRTVVVNPDQDVPEGSSAEITVTQVVTNDGSTGPGQIQFKVEEFAWVVGGTSVKQGIGTSGNMTDNWKTPFVNLPGS
jgi:peptidoglycan hydrolase-like protein with peptidoglycan-binding domain